VKSTPKEQRPTFFPDPASDRLTAIITALTAEVGVLMDRVDAIESIARSKGIMLEGEVDAYQPTPEEAERRRRRRDAYIGRVFFVLEEEFKTLEE
jgi:hypothetical protein